MIFVPIAKNASSTVRTILKGRVNCSRAQVLRDRHAGLDDLRSMFPGDDLALAVIRDPVDRALSIYHWISAPGFPTWGDQGAGMEDRPAAAVRTLARFAMILRGRADFFRSLDPATLGALGEFLPGFRPQFQFLETDLPVETLILIRFDRLQEELGAVIREHFPTGAGKLIDVLRRRDPVNSSPNPGAANLPSGERMEISGAVRRLYPEDCELWDALSSQAGPFIAGSVSDLLEAI